MTENIQPGTPGQAPSQPVAPTTPGTTPNPTNSNPPVSQDKPAEGSHLDRAEKVLAETKIENDRREKLQEEDARIRAETKIAGKSVAGASPLVQDPAKSMADDIVGAFDRKPNAQ